MTPSTPVSTALTIWQPSTRVSSAPGEVEDEDMKAASEAAPQLRLSVPATALVALAPQPQQLPPPPSSRVTRDGAACRALVLYAPPPSHVPVPRPLPPPRPPSPGADSPSEAPPQRLRTWAGGDAAMMEGEWDADDASEGSVMAID